MQTAQDVRPPCPFLRITIAPGLTTGHMQTAQEAAAGGGGRVAPSVAPAADDQPEMGDSESRRRSPAVLSQARIASSGGRRHEQARTFKPLALIRVLPRIAVPSLPPAVPRRSSPRRSKRRKRRTLVIVAHVVASAYHQESWHPDRVPGLLPGVSTSTRRRPADLLQQHGSDREASCERGRPSAALSACPGKAGWSPPYQGTGLGTNLGVCGGRSRGACRRGRQSELEERTETVRDPPVFD